MSLQRVKQTPITRTAAPPSLWPRPSHGPPKHKQNSNPLKRGSKHHGKDTDHEQGGKAECLKGKPGQTPIPKLRHQVDASPEVLVVRLERSGQGVELEGEGHPGLDGPNRSPKAE
jgi:hypothetical protein